MPNVLPLRSFLSRYGFLLCLIAQLMLCTARSRAQTGDTVTFTNGDKLTGKVIKVAGGSLSFHSDVLGDITVPLTKVAALATKRTFAAGEKGEHLTRGVVSAKVPVGKIAVENGTFRVTPRGGETQSFPVENLGFLIDEPTFRRALHDESDLLFGWTGSATVGATVVKATNSSQTYTGNVALVRAMPPTAGLPPISRTTLNLTGTYGLAKDPTILSGGHVFQTASITKTDILHGDTEYDRYLSRSLFGLVSASADHNFGNGLQLQQAYGGGAGWSVLRHQNNTLDLKATLQYEQQQFYNNLISGLGTPNENLVGVTLSESWNRTFGHNIKFTQDASVMSAFNVVQAGSAVADAKFLFPLYQQINFTVSSTDNYLGDPPEGFQRNTFQFTTGITYTLK